MKATPTPPLAWSAALRQARAAFARHAARAAGVLGLSLAAAVTVTLFTPPTYRSRALVRVGDWRPTVEAPPRAVRDDEPAAAAEELLRSAQVAAPVVRRLHLERDPDYAAGDDRLTAESLLRRVAVSRTPGGSLLAVTVTDHHPAVAAVLANALVAELQRQLAARRTASLAAGDVFLRRRLAETHTGWRAAQAALLAFRATHAADAAGPDESAALARLLALSQAATQAEIALGREQAATAAGNSAPGAALSVDEQRPWAQLRQQRAALAAEASRLAAQYGPRALPLVQARRALASVDDSLAEIRRLTLAGHLTSARADRLEWRRFEHAAAEELAWVRAAEQNAAEDQRLAAAATSQKTLYEDLWRQRQLMAVTAGLLRNPVQVLAPARVSPRPIRPRWTVNLALGLLAGLLLAALLVAGEEARAAEQLGTEALVAAALPCLASLPALMPAPAAGPRHARVRIKLPRALGHGRVADEEAPLGLAPWAELPPSLPHRLDDLVASLLLAASDSMAVLLLTSTWPGEGKTTVALWLARALTAAGGRALLLDLHAAAAALSRALARPGAPGLAEYLAGECGLEALLASAGRAENGLGVVGAGRVAAPAAALAGPALRRLVAEARRRFDWVLLDSGALFARPAVRLLAAQADATLLVARPARTRADELARAARLLAADGARLLGVVLNAAPAAVVSAVPSSAARPPAPLPAAAPPAERVRAAAS